MWPGIQEITQGAIDAFIKDVTDVFVKHGMSLDYDEAYRTFLIHTRFTGEDAEEMRLYYGSRENDFHVSYDDQTRFRPNASLRVSDDLARILFEVSVTDRTKVIHTDAHSWPLDGDVSWYRGVIIAWDEDHDKRIMAFVDDLSRTQREALVLAYENQGGIELVWRGQPRLSGDVSVQNDSWTVTNSILTNIVSKQPDVRLGRSSGQQE